MSSKKKEENLARLVFVRYEVSVRLLID